MAITLSDYKQTKYPNIYKSKVAHTKKGYKFLYWAKIEGKLHKKILGYSKQDHLTERSASLKADEYRKMIEEGYAPNKSIKLDQLF